ncbi:metal-sensing transcriptional repressor [Patescibacteria group bacterium]|nr:metal-sensing transcriptional repressor [Patescibacteria group bacterium]
MKEKRVEKQEVVVALKKAKSLMETIIGMLEKGDYCVDIMQQNLAVIGLLKSAHAKLMENHLHTCFMRGMNSQNPKRKEQMIDEIVKVMSMGNR